MTYAYTFIKSLAEEQNKNTLKLKGQHVLGKETVYYQEFWIKESWPCWQIKMQRAVLIGISLLERGYIDWWSGSKDGGLAIWRSCFLLSLGGTNTKRFLTSLNSSK